jgi:ubiquinone/menaquinone biosynthesis C-methylase UbiE
MNQFMTDEEYETCFTEFWGIRSKIAHILTEYGLNPGSTIMDIPSGHGFFAYEIARYIKRGRIYAVGLHNDFKAFKAFSRSVKDSENLKSIFYNVMDAAQLAFSSESFDFVVNFLGLEDINMTKGIEGVKQSLSECVRVLNPGGFIQITLCLEGNEPDQVLAKEIMEYCLDGVFFSKSFYVEELERLGITMSGEKWFHTRKKMTADQAKEELRFCCEEAPIIFADYHVRSVSFDELWQKFGEQIESHGVAYYSDLCMLIGQK